jgi:gas vesicle protein
LDYLLAAAFVTTPLKRLPLVHPNTREATEPRDWGTDSESSKAGIYNSARTVNGTKASKDRRRERRGGRMSRAKRNISWFLVGIGVGTVVSLLFAPVAGEDLREQLASSARERAENASEGFRQAAETFKDFADRGREKINDVVDEGQDLVENSRSQWKDYVERGQDAINEQVDKL